MDGKHTRIVRVICLGMLLLVGTQLFSRPRPRKEFELCMQSYTFHRFTLEQAMDKTRELGIKYLEVFPGQRLGGAYGDCVFDFRMDSLTRDGVKRMAADRGLRIVATGVLVPQDAREWPLIFAFARDMGIGIVTCEPAASDWDLVERLSRKTGIRVAVHNHPKPSHYWHPDSLLADISGRSRRIGSCADVGHWSREGLDPVECLKKLDGRVVMSHFKDIAVPDGDAERHDVIWGTGSLDLPAMLRELKRQRFDGYLSVEYEYNWENSVPDIRECIARFRRICDEF